MERLPAPVIQMSQRSMRVNKRYSEIRPSTQFYVDLMVNGWKKKGADLFRGSKINGVFQLLFCSVFCANLKSWQQDKLKLPLQC